jgi:hypothetical protein
MIIVWTMIIVRAWTQGLWWDAECGGNRVKHSL